MGSSKVNGDIAYEILSRTDIKELDLCKTVCKEWNAISFESNFISTHCERTGTISGYFVQNYKEKISEFVDPNDSNKDISFGFLPTALRRSSAIVASTKQGILCFKSDERRKECFFVCKPTTQQWAVLPNPKMRFFTVKIGIAVVGSDPLHYKIMRISNPNKRKHINNLTNYHCEMFDSETWRWMMVNDLWLPYSDFIDMQPCVVVGGLIYSLLSNNHVLEFNTYTQNHTIFPLPQPLNLKHPQLVEYKGKLGFVCATEDPYVYMGSVLKSYERRVWEEIEIPSLEKLRGKDDLGRWCIGFWNADIVMSDGFKIFFYNLRDDTFKVRGCHNYVLHDNIFVFRSDLVPTPLMAE